MKLMRFTENNERNESINSFLAVVGFVHCIALTLSAVIRITKAITVAVKKKDAHEPSSDTAAVDAVAVEETTA